MALRSARIPSPMPAPPTLTALEMESSAASRVSPAAPTASPRRRAADSESAPWLGVPGTERESGSDPIPAPPQSALSAGQQVQLSQDGGTRPPGSIFRQTTARKWNAGGPKGTIGSRCAGPGAARQGRYLDAGAGIPGMVRRGAARELERTFVVRRTTPRGAAAVDAEPVVATRCSVCGGLAGAIDTSLARRAGGALRSGERLLFLLLVFLFGVCLTNSQGRAQAQPGEHAQASAP